MTDIYVGGDGPPWRRVVIILVILLLGAIWFLRRSPDADIAESAPETLNSESSETAEVTEAPPSAPLSGTLPELNDIRALIEAENLHGARDLAFERLESLPPGPQRLSTESILGDLHTRMVFNKIPMAEKVIHQVGRGDTLGKLAQQHNTTPELIAASNGISNNLIRLGETLRILSGEFHCVVNKTRNDMVVTLNGRFFKRYAVGTGTHNSTPAGDYVITLRMRHPVWYRPDGEQFPYGHPENLLGTHYLKLNTPGIGLHGTWKPETVGSQSSAGCVRFKNEMIEELYKLLPEGTSVRIEDGS